MNILKKIFGFLFEQKGSGSPESQVSTGATTQRPAQTPQHPAQAAQRPGVARAFFKNSSTWGRQPHDPDNSGAVLTVYDPQRVPVRLGAIDQKGRGGESTVYQLPDNPDILIKIYKPETIKDCNKAVFLTKRIQDMQALESYRKKPYLAWPRMEVYDHRRQVIGFAMAKCSGISFKSLCGPARISKLFPGWDRLMLARVALDFVRKLHLLAQDGILVNDFNLTNFLVDQAGNVSFIDCDSFQVPAAGGGVHVTQTHFADYVAPEILDNKNLLKQPRTVHQVEFAAAMIIFHILMCGQYPYNYCARPNQKTPEAPADKLKQGECPYGADAGASAQLPGGDWEELWNRLTDGIKRSLVTTFREGHADPRRRTSLPQFQHDLEELIEAMQQSPARRQLPLAAPHHQPVRTSYPADIGNNITLQGQKAQPAVRKNKPVVQPAGQKNKAAAQSGGQKNKPAAQPVAQQYYHGGQPNPVTPKKKKKRAAARKNQLAGAYTP